MSDAILTAVRKAVASPQFGQACAVVAVGWMRRHIEDGRGVDGEFQPIKELFGRKPTRKGMKERPGYRNGGQPLRDTGALVRSLRARASGGSGSSTITVSGLERGIFHDKGFSTKGPNFIPLTRRAARSHASGSALVPGKLTKGWDFLIAENGVTVPARPFIQPTKDDLQELAASVYLALKAQLEK